MVLQNASGETDLLIMNVNVNVMFRCEPGDYEASQVNRPQSVSLVAS